MTTERTLGAVQLKGQHQLPVLNDLEIEWRGNVSNTQLDQPDQRFAAIFAGGQFTCGVAADGQAWCWGLNFSGELGNGGYQDSLAPLPVTGGLYFSTLAPGGIHVCGITMDQQLYCWGNNEFGQLGR